jgi:large subunit ribosomal protein L21
MMYAVIETGGKQYRVEPGDVLDVELTGDGEDKNVVFDRVLLVSSEDGIQVGAPVIEGARVTAALLNANARGPKIKVFKKKRRKGYKRTQGHRQHLHRVRVADIAVD